jgi:signal peptide peptidase SppA
MAIKLARVMERLYCDRWLVQPSYHASVIAPIVQKHVSGEAHKAGIMDAFGGGKEDPIGTIKDGIGYVMLDGVISRKVSSIEKSSGITDVGEVAEAVKSMAANDAVRGIMLMIDSPGGTVGGVPELAEIVANARQYKRILSFCDGMACSAAYWVASQADEVVISQSASVGSIGVYLPMMDSTRAHEMAGLKQIVIKSGTYKGMGLPGTSLSAEQENFLRESVESLHGQFKEAVIKGRGMKIDDAVMQGQDYMGKEAVSRKLADEVGDFEFAVSELETLIRVKR